MNEFLYQLNLEIAKYFNIIRKKDEIGILKHIDKKRVIFLKIAYKIITQWLYPYSVSRSSSEDENFITSSEVKNVMQLVNLVLGTNIYYDFSKHD